MSMMSITFQTSAFLLKWEICIHLTVLTLYIYHDVSVDTCDIEVFVLKEKCLKIVNGCYIKNFQFPLSCLYTVVGQWKSAKLHHTSCSEKKDFSLSSYAWDINNWCFFLGLKYLKWLIPNRFLYQFV